MRALRLHHRRTGGLHRLPQLLLIAWIRDGLYIEHDHDAIDEYSWFELKPSGKQKFYERLSSVFPREDFGNIVRFKLKLAAS